MTNKHIMRQFFKYFAASTLAIIVTSVIVVLIFFGIIAAVSSDAKGSFTVKNDSVLELSFDFRLSETSYTDFNSTNFQLNSAVGLDEFRATIARAKEDEKIEGILLNLSTTSYSLATLKEARQILEDFKASGKFITAYSESLSQGAYYMASVADEIYLYPEANMEFLGLSAEMAFFKNAIDKLGVDVQIIRGSNNKFKSAVEPFMYDKMSPANRKQVERFLNSLWSDMLTDISKDRDVSKGKLNQIADSLWAITPTGALEHKLIDGIIYQDQLDSILMAKTEIKEGSFNLVSFNKYRKALENKSKIKTSYTKGNVAVIYATGGIESGKGDHQTIGSESLSKNIKDARENENVKAIVLRINSPGGSALASDVIWRELELTKGVKPLIVSMGDLAASGGYYIACNADKIYAQPSTLTGSIGVFGIIPNMQNMLKEHLGVTFDVAKTNHHSMVTPFKPLTDDEKRSIQLSVDRIYDNFISKVADGRGITKAQVDSIGQGRVWTGSDAIEIGLVDELGSLQNAIDYAAEKAEIATDDIRVIAYPKQKKNELTEVLALLEELNNDDESASIKQSISQDLLNKAKEIDAISTQDVIQARMLLDVKIK